MKTADFIQQYQDGDVRQLAFLASKYPEVDMPYALDQIRGRQTARHKLPTWAAIDGIIYPPHLSMEQCSSEATAEYKTQIIEERGERREERDMLWRGNEHASRARSARRDACQSKNLGGYVSPRRGKQETQARPARSARRDACQSKNVGGDAPSRCRKQANDANKYNKVNSNQTTGNARARRPLSYQPDPQQEKSKEETQARQANVGGEEPSLCPQAENASKPSCSLSSLLSPLSSFIDLTGGFGVDFSYMARRLGGRAIYVEQQKHLCEVARHNFALLGLDNAEVICGDGVEVLHQLDHADVIYLDPARRDGAGNKVVSLADCTPDVTQIVDLLLEKADKVMIKLSPMLDWHKAVADLRCVREVHIVSVGNECKELLLVLSVQEKGPSPRLFCVNDEQVVEVFKEERLNQDQHITPLSLERGEGVRLLFSPNASLMKAGCFSWIASHYGLRQLAPNSHLFVGEQPIPDFPGRSFEIKAVCSLNKKELKRHLQGITHANIATRNFPLSVAELRKRLKLKDGGNTYIFATTLDDGSHVLIIATPHTTTA